MRARRRMAWSGQGSGSPRERSGSSSQKFRGERGARPAVRRETLDGFSFVIRPALARPSAPITCADRTDERTSEPIDGRRAATAMPSAAPPRASRSSTCRRSWSSLIAGLRRHPSGARLCADGETRTWTLLVRAPSSRSATGASSRSTSMPSPRRSPIRCCMAAWCTWPSTWCGWRPSARRWPTGSARRGSWLFWAATGRGGRLALRWSASHDQAPLVGASGAISGMMGAAARFGFRIDRVAGRSSAFGGPVLPVRVVLRPARRRSTFLAVWMVINLVDRLFGLRHGRRKRQHRLGGAYRRLPGRLFRHRLFDAPPERRQPAAPAPTGRRLPWARRWCDRGR